MSSISQIGFESSSKEYTAWVAAVWKANHLRNEYLKQLEECTRLNTN